MDFPKLGEGYYTHPNTGLQRHREMYLTKMQSRILYVRNYDRIKINRYWDELEIDHNDAPPVDNKTVETPINNNVKQEKKMKKETETNDVKLTGELQLFNNPEFGQIRTMLINDEPYFVGMDIAKALGYEKARGAITQHVDNEDALKQGVPDNQGFIQNTTLINESGVYSLIFGSKLQKAKAFKKWVTSEVLPSIRKNGAYMTESTIEKALTSPDFLIQLATTLKEEQDKRIALEKENAMQNQKLQAKTEEVKQQTQVIAPF